VLQCDEAFQRCAREPVFVVSFVRLLERIENLHPRLVHFDETSLEGAPPSVPMGNL
jgi:hypothetical protein